jgi:hypothetical protein
MLQRFRINIARAFLKVQNVLHAGSSKHQRQISLHTSARL